ncbi:hypothetical protein S83_028586, partial [Arachis hypogaea]
SLQERAEPLDVGGGSSPGGLDPPSSYPVPEAGLVSMDDLAFSSGLQHMSAEEKKELLVVARNSLEFLSSIINSEAEPKTLKKDFTLSLLDKCKHSLSIMKEIAKSTTDDEDTLFEALYLNDELQQIVSKYEELEAAQWPVAQEPPNADTAKHDVEAVQNPIELPKRFEEDESEEFEATQELERKLPKKSNGVEANATNGDGHHVETTILDEAHEKDNAESKVPSQTLAFFNGSLISAANLSHGLFLAPRYLTSFNTGIGPDLFTSAAATAAVGFRATTPLPLSMPMALVFNIKKSNLVMS